MPAKVVYSLVAVKELEESSDWYEASGTGLGKRFVLLVRETLRLAALNPEGFPKKKGHLREVVTPVFPYVIVYRYDKKEDTISVLHVFHTKRNPKLKYKRK